MNSQQQLRRRNIQDPKLTTETAAQRAARLAWWTEARFGLFIHWGLYSLPSLDWNIKERKRLTEEQYRRYFDRFDPDLYDPRAWARQAKAAGMRYAVITARHIEGFCLFDSQQTDYSSVHTPCGKDLFREWVDAFRAEGLRVGFYYALIDWHHPHFVIDRLHPLRGPLGTREEYDRLNQGRDMAIYRDYMRRQLTELLTNYGPIDLLFLDWSYPGEFGKGRADWGSVELVQLARRLQPEMLINDRADLRDVEGGWDFVTPEQVKVNDWPEVDGRRAPWEVCYTLSGSWGYHRDEATWKDVRQLLVLLIETVSKGGNLLLNVGPTGRGTFDDRAQTALAGLGGWMQLHGRAIYGCTQAPAHFRAPANTLLTYNPQLRRLYVHLLDYPLQKIRLPGYQGQVAYAQFLHDASELPVDETSQTRHWDKDGPTDLSLWLPVLRLNVEIPVIELFLAEDAAVPSERSAP